LQGRVADKSEQQFARTLARFISIELAFYARHMQA
jgi:hypothetical protein